MKNISDVNLVLKKDFRPDALGPVHSAIGMKITFDDGSEIHHAITHAADLPLDDALFMMLDWVRAASKRDGFSLVLPREKK